MSLDTYEKKRNFEETPEPRPRRGRSRRQPIFVVQEHHASRLHYDFRLEADGVLKSWAIPKQPTLDPSVKRLAVRVEDHPLAYARFRGTIPEGQYGAGTVAIWDEGTYENVLASKPRPQTLSEGIQAGHLEVVLHGQQLKGRFALVRLRNRDTKEHWLLVKMVGVLQNARGHTAVPPYVLRAVPQATVSTPLAWHELTPTLDPRAFTLRTLFERLAGQTADPLAPLVQWYRSAPAAPPRGA